MKPPSKRLHVVLNWFEELKAKVSHSQEVRVMRFPTFAALVSVALVSAVSADLSA